MSEAYHQHLQNLSWWEQIDRFFNPGKYSCTTGFVYGDLVWHCMLLCMFIIFVGGIILWFFARKYRVEVVDIKEGDIDGKRE
jgi:cytochrome b subunit of formate dehydrogenase